MGALEIVILSRERTLNKISLVKLNNSSLGASMSCLMMLVIDVIFAKWSRCLLFIYQSAVTVLESFELSSETRIFEAAMHSSSILPHDPR